MSTVADISLAIAARDAGMQQALDHADAVHEGWSERAYDFLQKFLQDKPAGYWFMMEDIRRKSIGVLPEPPHKRSWGGIAVRARKAGLIKANGTRPVTNIKAHRANATLWVKI